MIFTAQVHIFVWPYMETGKEESHFHTVEAETEKEAEEKINKHYKDKSSEYSVDYGVNSVNFFEHIT